MAFNLQAAVEAAIAAAVNDANSGAADLQATIAGLNAQINTLKTNLAASTATIGGQATMIGSLEAQLKACKDAVVTPVPVPVPVPVPAPTPSPTSFPDASNTGVPAGTTLTNSGDITASTVGQVVSRKNVTGTIYVNASNVVIEKCKITASNYWAIRVISGTGVIVRDCTIIGQGQTHEGIMGRGTFERNNISGVENGIGCDGKSLIKDNYIHHFSGPGSAHYDGIEINSGTDIDIIHNTILLAHGQTACVMTNNYFGPLARVKVDNNYVRGGGYPMYCDDSFGGGSVSNISFTNNRIGKGQWGYWALYGSGAYKSGNVDADTGNPV